MRRFISSVKGSDWFKITQTDFRVAADSGDLAKIKKYLDGLSEEDAIKCINDMSTFQVKQFGDLGDMRTGKVIRDPALVSAIKNGHLSIVKELIKRGANVNIFDGTVDSRPPLIHAVLNQDSRIFSALLACPDIDVNRQVRGLSPLELIIQKNDQQKIDLLLAHPDIRVDNKNRNGIAPLQVAARYGDIRTIDKLLAKNAEINIQDDYSGDTPIHFALREFREATMVEWPTPEAVMEHRTKMWACVERLRRGGADLTIQNARGVSAGVEIERIERERFERNQHLEAREREYRQNHPVTQMFAENPLSERLGKIEGFDPETIPKEYLCEIREEIMVEPVTLKTTLPDGSQITHHYERKAIELYYNQQIELKSDCAPLDPFTRVPIKLEDLKVDKALQSTIEEYVSEQEAPKKVMETKSGEEKPVSVHIASGLFGATAQDSEKVATDPSGELNPAAKEQSVAPRPINKG